MELENRARIIIEHIPVENVIVLYSISIVNHSTILFVIIQSPTQAM